MAGIFPDSGVACTGIQNAACGIETVGTPEECAPLYYNQRCNVQVSPLQINALISEIANAVNLTDPYDCSKLNNLKTTLATIQNLCTQPDQPAVDFDDYVAGCFDGVSGKINVSLLANLILAEVKTLCQLPAVTTAADTDSLAGCFAGQDARITLGNLKSLIGGVPALSHGAIFYQSPNSLSGSFSVSGRTEFILVPYASFSDDGSIAQYTVGGISFNNPNINATVYPVLPLNKTYPVIKRNGNWYLIDNGTARLISTTDTIQWTHPIFGPDRISMIRAYNGAVI